MTITYVDVIPTLIENTTMQQRLNDGVPYTYRITPIDGYVIHDKTAEWVDMDLDTGEWITKPGYKSGTVSCGANYDFVVNPREFYAVLASSVPADQIFGGGNNNAEIM